MTETGKKGKNWVWPPIQDSSSALEAARAGVVGGGIMIAGLLIATGMAYISGNNTLYPTEDLRTFYIYQVAQMALAALLTWRVYTGRGRFASILLLIWLVVEVGLKLVAGQLNVGWGIMWFAAIMSLVNSVRGSWAYPKFKAT